MHLRQWIFVTLGFVCLGIYGCSSSGGDADHFYATPPSSSSLEAGSSAPALTLDGILAAQGLMVVNSVTCNDPKSGKAYTGYLATFNDKFTEGTNAAGAHVGPLPKQCLVMSGSSYCMGYQMGALMPAETARMVNEYIFTVPGEMLGIKRSYFPALFDFLEGEVRKLCTGARPIIPGYLIDEMDGIAAGAKSQGYDVSADNVLLLNEGYDAIYSILFTGVLPSMQAFKDWLNPYRTKLTLLNRTSELLKLDQSIHLLGDKVVFPLANPYVMGCNEFVASGKATDGAVYHGRDFMFSTGDMYQDSACMAVYLPEEGYPFAAVTAPGFVGHPTLLNSQGLSMGIDVVLGACTRSTPGVGGLLLMRDIVQHCKNLDQAVAWMKEKDRGVSWIYIMADNDKSATYTNGVVIEAGRSTPAFAGPDVMPLLNQLLFLTWTERLDPQPLPDKGLMFRTQNWQYPAAFESGGTGTPGFLTYLLYFPQQGETWDDVVLTTNHYIIPRMVFTTFTPLMDLNGAGRDLQTSLNRYNLLRDLIKQAYGQITFDKAAELIDFLNPNRGLDTKKRYTIGGPVKGHHAAIDNTNQVLTALFGYYGNWQAGVSDTWVQLDMKPFAQYLEQMRSSN